MGIAVYKQGRLIDSVDDPICGDILCRATEPGKGGEQVCFMDNIPDDLSRLNRSWPPRLRDHAYTAFEEIPLPAAEDSFSHAEPWGGVVAGPGPDDLTTTLQRHGIAATALTVAPKTGQSVGEAILSETAALGADLLVKGAYTHSRLRQMIFGGATRHLIYHAELPVLMAN